MLTHPFQFLTHKYECEGLTFQLCKVGQATFFIFFLHLPPSFSTGVGEMEGKRVKEGGKGEGKIGKEFLCEGCVRVRVSLR